jgi:ubiquitin thioesterase protein OTUB1
MSTYNEHQEPGQVPLDDIIGDGAGAGAGTLSAVTETPSTSTSTTDPTTAQQHDVNGTDAVVMTMDTENKSNNNSDDHQYIQQERMVEEIAKQIKQEQSLTSEKLRLSSIQQQYRSNNNNNSSGSTTATTTTDTNTFITGLMELQNTYSHIRTVRGDGNCYYRAFLYSLLEQLIRFNHTNQSSRCSSSSDNNNNNNSVSDDAILQEGQRIYEYIKTKSWKDILQQNYDEMAIEIFHDEMIDIFHKVIIDQVYTTKTTTATTIVSSLFHEAMNEENSISDYCTWYLRLITATYIKQDTDRFLPFILSLSYDNNNNDTIVCDVNQFCSKYIEPMGQECEHVQVLALAEAFQIHVRIEYLDGRSFTISPSTTTNSSNNNRNNNIDTKSNSVYCHQFGPETSPIQITLLYRPGHYDILYKK